MLKVVLGPTILYSIPPQGNLRWWWCLIILVLIDVAGTSAYFARKRGRYPKSPLFRICSPLGDALFRYAVFLGLYRASVIPIWVIVLLVYCDLTVSFVSGIGRGFDDFFSGIEPRLLYWLQTFMVHSAIIGYLVGGIQKPPALPVREIIIAGTCLMVINTFVFLIRNRRHIRRTI